MFTTFSSLKCTSLHCTALYCTIRFCTVLYCTLLYCTVPYCNVLYCTLLYCTVLYLTVLVKSKTYYSMHTYCTVPYCTLYLVGQEEEVDRLSWQPEHTGTLEGWNYLLPQMKNNQLSVFKLLSWIIYTGYWCCDSLYVFKLL